MEVLDIKSYIEEKNKLFRWQLDLLKRKNIIPRLEILTVSTNTASESYIKGIINTCSNLDIQVDVMKANSIAELYLSLAILKDASHTSSILIPHPIDSNEEWRNLESKFDDAIPVHKDVDNISGKSIVSSCTATGIVSFLIDYYGDIRDKNVVVFGRSKYVGMPILHGLINESCNVSIIHSNTSEENKRLLCTNADIIVSAIGKPNSIKYEYLKDNNRNLMLIDAGINLNDKGKLCGDVDPIIYEKINGLYTSVPGGVGLLTRAALVSNMIRLARNN